MLFVLGYTLINRIDNFYSALAISVPVYLIVLMNNKVIEGFGVIGNREKS